MIRIKNLYIHDNLHSELLQSIIYSHSKIEKSYCLHNNDGSDDNAVKAGLMLHGQRKKDIRSTFCEIMTMSLRISKETL